MHNDTIILIDISLDNNIIISSSIDNMMILYLVDE